MLMIIAAVVIVKIVTFFGFWNVLAACAFWGVWAFLDGVAEARNRKYGRN